MDAEGEVHQDRQVEIYSASMQRWVPPAGRERWGSPIVPHCHTVYMGCYECLPSWSLTILLNPLVERASFPQVPATVKSVDGDFAMVVYSRKARDGTNRSGL